MLWGNRIHLVLLLFSWWCLFSDNNSYREAVKDGGGVGWGVEVLRIPPRPGKEVAS